MKPARVNILGVEVSAIDMDIATATLEGWIRSGTPNYVCITGVHGVMESRRDPDLCQIHNRAGLVTPDGMPLVWMAHHLGFKSTSRVYGPDLMRRMSALSAEHNYRNYYFGGKPGIPDRLRSAMLRVYPNLQVVGTYSPPFGPVSPAEDDAIVDRINKARPDIVWVGLSTPKQERWMSAHIDRLNANVLVGVGAAFDFLAGDKPQAPAWMQRNGLEWLFRMATEPRRLAGRYMRNNPAFIYQAIRQLTSSRQYPQPEQQTHG
jgi:N-acetylglucosaminyldiphosphoundecaprenol N-acetyl-beta-D-mannosaminyltransferase